MKKKMYHCITLSFQVSLKPNVLNENLEKKVIQFFVTTPRRRTKKHPDQMYVYLFYYYCTSTLQKCCFFSIRKFRNDIHELIFCFVWLKLNVQITVVFFSTEMNKQIHWFTTIITQLRVNWKNNFFQQEFNPVKSWIIDR